MDGMKLKVSHFLVNFLNIIGYIIVLVFLGVRGLI